MTWQGIGNVVAKVAWSPAADKPLIAVAAGSNLFILKSPKICCSNMEALTALETLFSNSNGNNNNNSNNSSGERKKVPPVRWSAAGSKEQTTAGVLAVILHERPVVDISWHRRGEYAASIAADASLSVVVIHHLTKQQSQNPFRSKQHGGGAGFQCTAFHPTKPIFIVATQRHVRVYNLAKQELIKKCLSGVKVSLSLFFCCLISFFFDKRRLTFFIY